MKEIYKESQKDAAATYKLVKLKMSFLYWVNNHDTKVTAAEKTKDDILNLPEVGIRDTIAQCYNEDERQFYWKTFHDEYGRLSQIESVIP
ncbi:MAG TPA: hypothetical protein ENH82_17215 [bacterium]|nr:hypothetical protein [bacterium]